MPPKDPVVIHDAATTFEAQLVLDDLKSAGIEALMEAIVPQDGEAARQQIIVDQADEERARKLVESYQPDVDDEEEPPKTAECHSCGLPVGEDDIICPACGKPLIKGDTASNIKEVDSPFAHPPASGGGETILFGGALFMIGLAVIGMLVAIVALVFK
jgi:hypothetical protein